MAFRIYFGIASLAILVLCIVNYWIELTPAWKDYQREYYALLAEKIEDPAKAAQVAAHAAEVRADLQSAVGRGRPLRHLPPGHG